MISRCSLLCQILYFYFFIIPNLTDAVPQSSESKCNPYTEFRCVKSGLCIPMSLKCNSFPDCLDGSDEESAECKLRTCKPNQFTCKTTKKCIPQAWLCDKEADCGIINGVVDNSDEDGHQCQKTFSCSIDSAPCGNTSICIKIEKFCNGVIDCPDKSDEGAYCHENFTKQPTCSFGFKPVNGELRCYCPRGKQLKQNDCVDLNECLIDGSCDQICHNTNGSYHCDCVSGYQKIEETACKAINEPTNSSALLLFSTTTSIHRTTLDGNSQKLIEMHTLSLTFDHRNQSVCFINRPQNETKTFISCIDENFLPLWSRQGPAMFPLESSTHVSLDWVSGNWYFVDDTNEMIFVCSPEMTSCVVLIDVNISKPKALALDPTKGFMFFTKFGVAASLERALLNGKERVILVDHKIVYPYGVTVDFPLEHVYWVDTYLDFVEKVDYDGNNRQTVRKGFSVQNLYDVVVFENNLFLSSWSNMSIIKLNKFQNEDHQIITNNISRPFSVIVYHRQRQPEVVHPCKVSNGGCQHICIPLWQNKTIGVAHCICESGFKMIAKRRCVPASKDSFLLYGKGRPAMIKGISIASNNVSVEEVIFPVTGLSNSLALDFDIKEQFIYFIDAMNGRKNTIERKKIDSFKKETVTKYSINDCKGLAIDWYGRNLYWTDEGSGTISVVSLKDFSKRRTLMRDKKSRPVSIALNPKTGYMYWSQWKPGIIGRSGMDGYSRMIFLSTDLVWPNGLTIDFLSNKLYWCDSYTDRMEWIHLNGQNRTLIPVKVNHPYGLAIFEDMIFWTENQKGLLRSFNFKTNEDDTLIAENAPLYDLKAFGSRSQNVMALSEIWCLNVGRCQELCIMSPEGSKCLCADGTVSNNCTKSSENSTLENCDKDSFQCLSLDRCIDKNFMCDGNKDCIDGSDEERGHGGACESKTCTQDEFQCDMNKCISKSWICDGEEDCNDKTDEQTEYCVHNTCGRKQFTCIKSKRCIPMAFVCDGEGDCGEDDSSDENCPHHACSVTEFACRNGACIPLDLLCNGEDNCNDCSYVDGCVSSSDEASCLGYECEEDQFLCKADVACLPNEKRCDGKTDCTDGFDERDCSNGNSTNPYLVKCEESEFQCLNLTGKCIPKKYVCDGKPDCLDNSDELDCEDSDFHDHKRKMACDYPSRLCDRGTACITIENICNNFTDCVDESDEGGHCGDNFCATAECSDYCQNTPEGYTCLCPGNMFLDNNNITCTSLHRCDLWGTCSQKCLRTGIRSHKCQCFDGYELQSDQFSCKFVGNSPPQIVFSNRNEIRSIDLRTLNVKSLTVGLKNTVALDFYYTNNSYSLFWTDVIDDKIFKGTLDEEVGLTDIDVVVKSGLNTAEGLAVDWMGENLYWVESNLDQIEVARLNGSFRYTLIAGDLESPRAIALDPRFGLLFWTDWDNKAPRIERCSMSGEHRSIIVRVDDVPDGEWPNGLTLDYQLQRVFWVDARSHTIFSVNYDGHDLRELLKEHQLLNHPFAISLFENYAYWTDWRPNSIVRVNKWNSSDLFVIHRSLTQLSDIKIVHPSRQPRSNYNPCGVNNGNCSHLCLLNMNQTYKCACPHIMILTEDNRTCIENEEFLLYSRPNEIRGADLIQPYHYTVPPISVPSVFNPIELDFDAFSKSIYWIDSHLKEIRMSHIVGGSVESIVNTGVNNAGGLAVDWISKTLFISTVDDEASIVACNLRGEYFSVIYTAGQSDFSKKIVSIKSLAVQPSKGRLFWSVMQANSKYAILESDMLARKREILTSHEDNEYLDDPSSLVVDESTNCLYWINKESHVVQFMNLVTHKQMTLTLGTDLVPVAVTIHGNNLYFATATDIYIANKITGRSSQVFRSNTSSVNSLIMYDAKLQNGTNACATNNGNCSHLCIPVSSTGRVCKCSMGYTNDPQNTTECIGIKEFILFSINWEIKGISMNSTVTSVENVLAPISHIAMASSVDFDSKKDYIYWADSDHGTITRIKRDGSQRETIIGLPNHDSTQTDWLAGIALDWVSGNIYWTDPRLHVIEVSRVNGSHRKVLINTKKGKPIAIAVDPVRGLLFWSENGETKRIRRSTLTGTAIRTIVNRTESHIYDITLDYEESFLYWCDMSGIYSVKYNGENRQLLFSENASHPYGIVAYEKHLYWIDIVSNHGSLKKAPLNNLTTYVEVLNKIGDSLRDIVIFSDVRQTGSNPCAINNGGCQELCLFDGVRAVCNCSYSDVDSDGKSCKPYDVFLMYSRIDHIDSIHITDADDLNPPYRSIKSKLHILNTIGVSFDYSHKLLFYSDIQKSSINSVFFNGSDHRVIIDHVGSVEGIVFEPVENLLLWTCNSNSSINSMRVYGKNPKPSVVVKLSEEDKARGIDVDSCNQRVYWTNWNTKRPSIQRAYLNGFQLESIITTNIKMPNAITLDHFAQKLYWSDARIDKIERCEFDGSQRIIIPSVNPQHAFGMAVFGDYLFWTDWVKQAVMRCDKYTGENVIELRSAPRPMGIVAVSNSSLSCVYNKCKKANGGCQDICQLDMAGAVECSCYEGRRLLKDGYRCAAISPIDDFEFNCTSQEFRCSDRGCISYELTCDGIPQCMDRSDEDPVYCVNRKCRSEYFACDHNRCLSESVKCDGTHNCRDESDEFDCPCPLKKYQCPDCNDKNSKNCTAECERSQMNRNDNQWVRCNTTGKCIHKQWVCDRFDDCGDNSDEMNCDLDIGNVDCGKDKFKCLNDQCIPEIWHCDGDYDCMDNLTISLPSSDEINCPELGRCKSDSFQCENKETCILKTWVCDGNYDCADGSDEKNCHERKCLDTEFRCNSTGRCIPLAWMCDHEYDCVGGQDESVDQDCIPYFSEECTPDKFMCTNNKCIQADFFCDEEDDCGDKSDEPKDCKACESPSNFLCQNRKCVPLSLTCDGKDDCGDNSDEYANNTFCAKPHPRLSCEDKSTFMCRNLRCINESKVCDGVDDCGDLSDETRCNIADCKIYGQVCQQKCVEKKIGYECECFDGYQRHPTLPNICVDVNECKNRPCSQICINEIGSYKCVCTNNYVLLSDKHSCKLDDQRVPHLLVTNKQFIREVDFQGNSRIKIHNLTNTVGLDYDYDSGCLYWSEVTKALKKIQRDCPGKETHETLHSNHLQSPDGLAVDWVAKNLYWCDKGLDTIEVSRLDGKFKKILIGDKELLGEPRAIVLDPANGVLFWSDWGKRPYIGKAGMDGSNPRIIINETLGWPNALTISYETKEIFWGDAKLDYIAVADFEGNNKQVVLSRSINPSISLHHVFAIAVFEDYVFWTDWETQTVERCNKYSGQECRTLTRFNNRPMDIRVFHPFKQPAVKANPCKDNGGCQGLCLLTPNGDATCTCPDGFEVGSDNVSCVANCSSSHFVCPNTLKCIPMWWRCDTHDDCGDGWDEPTDCPPFSCVPGQFQCGTECFHPSVICDGIAQCMNKDDEKNCDKFACMDTHFKCGANETRSAFCISNELKCNGRKNCPNGEDEQNCPKNCKENEFRCKASGKCIPLILVCDEHVDCEDSSDEMNCMSNICPNNQFRCKNGRCIMNSWVCDGEKDCPAADDEPQAECDARTCDPSYFKCANNKCIPGRWKCDFDDDCGDESDETNCTYKNCTEFEFRCNDGTCIANNSLCDGQIDCADKSDELECNVTCNDDQFRCHNKSRCIPINRKCDGEIDCLDGSDEMQCMLDCKADQFKCNNSVCISDSWQCDGEDDCGDGSDEIVAHCVARSCPPSKFRCRNHMCILKSMVCNGKNNCGDDSDEDIVACEYVGNCPHGAFKCANNHCINKTLVCDGQNDCGDNSDEEKCVSECHFGSCSQECYVKRHVAHCHCAPGYWLHPSDNKTCHASGNAAYLAIAIDSDLGIIDPYRATDNFLKKLTLSKSGHKVETFDMMWSKEEVLVFWANKHENHIFSSAIPVNMYKFEPILKKLENDSDQSLIKVEGEVQSIAVDWLSKVIYWLESSSAHHAIMAASIKGRFKKTLFDTNLYKPRDLIVDPLRGHIYWTECGNEAAIEIAGTDGSSRQTLVSHDLYCPFGLTIDYPAKRLYWIDSKLRLVECVDLHGSNRKFVFQFPSGMKPNRVDLFEDVLYVSIHQKNFVVRINKFGNGNITKLEGGLMKISDLVVYQENKHHAVDTPIMTKSSNITNSLCLTAIGGKKRTCMCGDGFVELKSSTKGSECICKRGWTSSNCDIPVKQCSLCLNGGECEPQVPTRCKCQEGFTGLRCDQCTSLRCQNGGSCIKIRGVKKCICPAGYSGQVCNVSKCDDYCKQGFCRLYESGPKCHCNPGYAGKRCDQNECKDFCKNGGNCTVTMKDISCHCPPLFSGRRCEINLCTCSCPNGESGCVCDLASIPEGCRNRRCSPGQCANGGTCHEISGKPYCSCPHPWTGLECSVRATSSDQITCKDFCRNGGLCLNGVKSPFCHCKSNWAGLRCAERSDCVHYCFNGGTCQESSDILTRSCICPDEYCGSRCQTKRNNSIGIKDHSPHEGSHTFTNQFSLLHLLLALTCTAIGTAFVYSYIVYRNNRGAFMHVRIQENNAVNNPMYLNGDVEEEEEEEEEEDEEDDDMNLDHATPLQDKLQSNTFANPVYESIYSVGGEHSTNSNEEKKGLLQNSVELHDSLSNHNEHVP